MWTILIFCLLLMLRVDSRSVQLLCCIILLLLLLVLQFTLISLLTQQSGQGHQLTSILFILCAYVQASPKLRFNKEGTLLAVSTADNGIKILANADGLCLLRTFESRTIDPCLLSESSTKVLLSENKQLINMFISLYVKYPMVLIYNPQYDTALIQVINNCCCCI